MGAIVGGNSAVGDGSFAAVCCIGTPRVGSGAFVCRAPAVARRAIRGGAVELSGRIVSRFRFSVTLLGGEVARPRGQPLTFAILCCLGAVFGCKPAVVDGLGAVVRSLSPPQGGLGTLVRRTPAIGRRPIPRGSIKITSCIVTRLSLSVTQAGRNIAVLRSHPRLPAARAGQLVRPGIVAVLGSLGTIFGRHPAVVDGLGAVVRSPSAPRGGLVAFVCGMLTVGRCAITCGSVKIARRVITRFGLSVAQSGGDVTVLRGEAGLPTAHTRQLVGLGIVAVRFSLSIALLGLSITDIRSQVAVAPFYIPLARRSQGVFVLIRQGASVGRRP